MGVDDAVGLLGCQLIDRGLVFGGRVWMVRHGEGLIRDAGKPEPCLEHSYRE